VYHFIVWTKPESAELEIVVKTSVHPFVLIKVSGRDLMGTKH